MQFLIRATLAEADIIMVNIENDFKTKILELEALNLQLKTQLSHSQETQNFIRDNLKSTDGNQNRNLVEKIFENEKNELAFMEKIFELERSLELLNQRVSDKEILKNELNDSMKDQQEILSQIQNLEKENRELLDEISRKKEVDFRNCFHGFLS